MQLIKGTDIELFSFVNGELSSETISNVLIGEPTGSNPNETTDGRQLGYTLAIPKGDTHDWTNRMVGFFGRYFRTLGYPEQGIEANIPLAWHKKVRVALMDTSGICTVYDAKTYAKHVYSNVCIRDARGGMRVSADGSSVPGELQVRIYAPLRTDSYIPKPNDIIVPGTCDIVFDTASPQTVSQSMAALRQNYPALAGIINTGQHYFGPAPDLVIEAR